MAVNQQTLQGAWNEIKGKIRERWGELTDDELQYAQGNLDRLVGLIQRKTGETRSAIIDYLDELTSEGASAIGLSTEALKEYLQSAAETLRDTTRGAAESVRHGYEETERLVREQPLQSLVVCFGAGLLVGLLVAGAMRPK